MIDNGNATVFVSDMGRAVDFYTKVLGLKLRMRAGDHWAEVEAGDLVIGLHPAGPDSPKPGTPGAVQIGLTVTKPLEDVVGELTRRGVAFHGPVVDDQQVRLAFFSDSDGNVLYLCEVKAAPARGASSTRG